MTGVRSQTATFLEAGGKPGHHDGVRPHDAKGGGQVIGFGIAEYPRPPGQILELDEVPALHAMCLPVKSIVHSTLRSLAPRYGKRQIRMEWVSSV